MSSGAAPEPPCLWGVVRFGDNIDDEWFAVWLLLQLTRQPMPAAAASGSSSSAAWPNLAARVWDDDGDFLLIEAAYALPRWLRPDTATNRVWLWGGSVHIVPLPSARHPGLPPSPSVAQALEVLASGAVATHYPRVADAVSQRLCALPAAGAGGGMHRVRALLPARLAAVLLSEPQLVAAAVEAFYYRDPDDMRLAARMAAFPPERGMAAALVRMSRCQYAQLRGQELAPPKRWPAAAAAAGGCGEGGSRASVEEVVKAADIGLKLSVGMEIVMARAKPHAGAAAATTAAAGSPGGAVVGGTQAAAPTAPISAAAAAAAAAALEANPVWQRYVAALERSGFFTGNVRGSAEHRRLREAAAASFTRCAAFASSSAALAAPAVHVAEILAVVDRQQQQQVEQHSGTQQPNGRQPTGPAPVGQQQQPFPQPSGQVLAAAGAVDTWPSSEDDDSWLQDQAAALDAEVSRREAEAVAHQQQQAKRQVGGGCAGGGGSSSAEAVDAGAVAAQVRGFVEALAGLEGAEVPGRRPRSGGAGAGSGGSSGGGGEVAFDASAFLRALAGEVGGDAGGGGGGGGGGGAAGQEEWMRTLAEGLRRAGANSSGVGGSVSDVGSSDEEGSSFYAASEGSEGSEEEGSWETAAASATRLAGAAAGGSGRGHRVARQARQGQQVQQRTLAAPSAAAAGAARPGGGALDLRPVDAEAGGGGGAGGAGLAAAVQLAWEVRTATDSDDDYHQLGSSCGREEASVREAADEGRVRVSGRAAPRGGGGGAAADDDRDFADAYSEVLEAQLVGTCMAGSFARLGAGGEVGGGIGGGREAGGGGGGLTPVDVDLNLVSSMLSSYAAQEGLAGPAGNLAGLLGLQLPAQQPGGAASSAARQGGGDGGS